MPMAAPLLDVKSRIAELKSLPAFPAVAMKIFSLRGNPNATIKELSQIVESDPVLAAQVMRYASSPFFAYRGKVDSVHSAISRVLGFDLVLNLSLGIAAAKPFKVPPGGPISLTSVWRLAIHCAALMQRLSGLLPVSIRPPEGMAYLAGLLHNIGYLLLGHLFPKEFMVLNKVISQNPQRSVGELEMETLGVEHSKLGAWLLEAWELPEELIVSAREHHNEAYYGSHSVYASLALISARALKVHGVGDGESADLPLHILNSLELSEYQVTMALSRVLEGTDNLDSMALMLAA
ncbi:MAG: HDOD domain-containing protein [Gammaproteobacteria bacterium]|nr:HDOD domain-containing protein [Gammaproteobacteria bacterium]